MIYNEFRERVGKITIPTGELEERLIKGQDSIHFVVHLGKLSGDSYEIDVSPANIDLFVEILDLLDKRHAIREKDYVVCGSFVGSELRLGVHTTRDFLSDEDFGMGIKRYYTK